MAIRSNLSRQGTAIRGGISARTPMYHSAPVSSRQASPAHSVYPGDTIDMTEIDPGVFDARNGINSGAPTAAPIGNPDFSGYDRSTINAVQPDIAALARGRLTSGVQSGIMAANIGAPTSIAVEQGLRTAFSPAGVLLASADDLLPGALALGQGQRLRDRAIQDVDPTGVRGVRDAMEGLEENRGTRRVNENNINALREIGFDNYVHADLPNTMTRMASRPFTTQIKDYVLDNLELGAKSLVGISQKEDLDRMIANDPAAFSAMKDPSSGTLSSAPGFVGRGPGSVAANSYSAYGSDMRGRDSDGPSRGGYGRSDGFGDRESSGGYGGMGGI